MKQVLPAKEKLDFWKPLAKGELPEGVTINRVTSGSVLLDAPAEAPRPVEGQPFVFEGRRLAHYSRVFNGLLVFKFERYTLDSRTRRTFKLSRGMKIREKTREQRLAQSKRDRKKRKKVVRLPSRTHDGWRV